MPSYLHQVLLLLFRKRSASAVDLLRELDVQLPRYDKVCIESSDLSDVRPTEYDALWLGDSGLEARRPTRSSQNATGERELVLHRRLLLDLQIKGSNGWFGRLAPVRPGPAK